MDLAGAVRLAGFPASYGWILQAGASAVAAGCVAWAWGRKGGRTVPHAANAVLVSATLTAMPFLLFYDLVMAGVAAAWLVRVLGEAGPRRPNLVPAWLAGCMMLSLLAFPLAAAVRLAVGAAVGPILLILAMRSIRSLDQEPRLVRE